MNATNITMNTTNITTPALAIGIIGTTNWFYVVLSYFISCLGAFTAFQLLNELRIAKSKAYKLLCVILSSLTLSCCCMWAMHFIGTVCFKYYATQGGLIASLDTVYSPLLTVMSAVTAFVLCLLGVFVCVIHQLMPFLPSVKSQTLVNLRASLSSRDTETYTKSHKYARYFILKRSLFFDIIFGSPTKPNIIQILIGSLLCSAGACAMLYMGIYATIVSNVSFSFDIGPVIGSIILSVLATTFVMILGFHTKREFPRMICSAFCALALCGGHYVGMASLKFEYTPSHTPTIANIDGIDLVLIVTLATSVTCFAMLVVTSLSGRKRRHESRRLQEVAREKEQIHMQKLDLMIRKIAGEEYLTRRVMELVSDAICVINTTGEIIKSNVSFNKLIGRPDGVVLTPVKDVVFGLPPHEEMFSAVNATYDVSVKNKLLGEVKTPVTSFAEDAIDVTYCVLIFPVVDSKSKPHKGTVVPVEELSLLDDPEIMNDLRELCAREHSLENLDFILKVSEYKKTPGVMERVAIQEYIVDTFLRQDSEKQLNLPSRVLSDAVTRATAGYGQLDMWNELEKEVQIVLHDSYFRYKGSKRNTIRLTV
ncbi:Rgs10 [Acrasis kona]|uniref:Rgs10 n=1 Tax=Acrasis kona TaxID=1008807 RepID=A0AAW2ZM26_9EUKA